MSSVSNVVISSPDTEQKVERSPPHSEPHSTALRQKVHLGDPVHSCLFLHVLCADDDDADAMSIQPEGAKKNIPALYMARWSMSAIAKSTPVGQVVGRVALNSLVRRYQPVPMLFPPPPFTNLTAS